MLLPGPAPQPSAAPSDAGDNLPWNSDDERDFQDQQYSPPSPDWNSFDKSVLDHALEGFPVPISGPVPQGISGPAPQNGPCLLMLATAVCTTKCWILSQLGCPTSSALHIWSCVGFQRSWPSGSALIFQMNCGFPTRTRISGQQLNYISKLGGTNN